MTTKTKTKKPISVPCAYISLSGSISLREFDESEIIAYLRSKGHDIDGISDPNDSNDNDLTIYSADLNRIETLALCGQKQSAHQLIFELVSKAIGRDIA